MRRLLERMFREEEGQDLAEYGIALALVAGFVVVVAMAIAGNVQTLWSNAQSTVQQVVDNE
jgi:Flp pilus assembly pilin Flp